MNSNPDIVFGGRLDTGVQFSDVLEYVKTMRPSALTTDALPDVIDILDYTRTQVIALHEQTEALAKQLEEKQAFLTKREAELSIRLKALRLVEQNEPATKPRYFWR